MIDSMITGVNPAKHSIWNNNVFGPLDFNLNNHYFYQVHCRLTFGREQCGA